MIISQIIHLLVFLNGVLADIASYCTGQGGYRYGTSCFLIVTGANKNWEAAFDDCQSRAAALAPGEKFQARLAHFKSEATFRDVWDNYIDSHGTRSFWLGFATPYKHNYCCCGGWNCRPCWRSCRCGRHCTTSWVWDTTQNSLSRKYWMLDKYKAEVRVQDSWHLGEIGGSINGGSNHQYCFAVDSETAWNDHTCSNNKPYMCEFYEPDLSSATSFCSDAAIDGFQFRQSCFKWYRGGFGPIAGDDRWGNNWVDAFQQCQDYAARFGPSIKGRLAHMPDPPTIAAVEAYIDGIPARDYPWIGAAKQTNAAGRNLWYWMDGPDPADPGLRNGQALEGPDTIWCDGRFDSTDTSQNCMARWGAKYWNDYPCTSRRSFVCEFIHTNDPCLSDPCNNDGTCVTAADGDAYSCSCESNVFGDHCEYDCRTKLLPNTPKDCSEVLDFNNALTSGLYWITPSINCVQVWCDMTTKGGGWTVIQSRIDGTQDFNQLWSNYVAGFGSTNAEHWIGLDTMKSIGDISAMDLLVEVKEHERSCKMYSLYNNFQLSHDGCNIQYRLGTLSFVSGDAGNSLTAHNGRHFTTRDADNDGWGGGNNCGSKYSAGWWFASCHTSGSNLNGVWTATYCVGIPNFGKGLIWTSARGQYYSFEMTEMKLRPNGYTPPNPIADTWCPDTTFTPCSGDCNWNAWNAWGACTNPNPGDTHSRTRGKTSKSTGGMTCQNANSETKNCPIDCEWDIWGPFGSCSVTCETGSWTRTRTISQVVMYDGVNCTGSNEDIQSCVLTPNCPIDCVWATWNPWSACTVTCGNGTRTRTRGEAVSAQYGGNPCPGVNSETEFCYGVNGTGTTLPFCPIDCAWAPWVEWSECSITCGNGTRYRNRTIAIYMQYNGEECVGNFSDIGFCYGRNETGAEIQFCPINCVWTEWIIPNKCTDVSGTCQKTSTRSIKIEGQHGGDQCNAMDNQITESCDDCHPMSYLEKIFASILMAIGCTTLLTLTFITFVSCLIFKIRNLERLIHACEEIVLFIGHLFILFLREATWDHTVCAVTSIGLQYTMTSLFVFFLLESIQMYAYVTNVLVNGNFIPWQINLLIGFGLPVVTTVVPSVLHYNNYPAEWSCWVNLGHPLSAATIGPLLTSSVVTIIIIEAAGQGEYTPLAGVNSTKRLLGILNQRGLTVMLPLTILHWIFGSYAIYQQHISLYVFVFAFNVAMGLAVLVFHGFIHAVVRSFFASIWAKIKSLGKKKKVDPSVDQMVDKDPTPMTPENANPATPEPEDDSAGQDDLYKWATNQRTDDVDMADAVLFGSK